MKRLFVLLLCMGLLHGVKSVEAASSAMLTFSTKKSDVKVGETFSVILTVSGSQTISGVNVYLTYDSRMMTFESGGKFVSGDLGLLHIEAQGLSGEDKTRKFSLKFKAVAPGGCAVSISDKAIVSDADGNDMSVSSNRLSLTMTGSAKATNPDENNEVAPPTDSLSDNNYLTNLKVHTGSLEPSFQQSVTDYKLTVDNDTNTLYSSITTADPEAIVTIEGNEGLKDGENEVKIIVTAPNGAKQEYKINVTKETFEETQIRLEEQKQEDNDNPNIQFKVYTEAGNVFLENAYRFQLVEIDDESLIPAGFIKTKVILYGTNITAFTIENDLDNEYLLIYAMNDNGDKNFYQYDRMEKTLQRYSGDLIQRVNENALNSKQKDTDEYNANLTQLAIIIAILAALCVLLLIGMIKIALKTRGISDDDDLNLK